MLSCQYKDQVLHLVGHLQVHHLENIKDDLVSRANDPNPLLLNLEKVEAVDVAGLQMVLAFLRSRKSSSKLGGIPPELIKAINITGLSLHLQPYID